jgi:hypothetical protein
VTCLDAPLVAISWQWLFARTFHARIDLAERAVLFLTAWAIYLLDRIGDSFSSVQSSDVSLRQTFCLQHRGVMILIVALIVPADATYALIALNRETLLCGAIVGALIGCYLAINHCVPALWKTAPVKELSIGFLFALGVVSSTLHGGFAFAAATLLFGTLCALNCLSISVWEMPLDRAQHRVSFATVLPAWRRLPETGCWLLAVTAMAVASTGRLQPLLLCITAAAVLLDLLHRFSGLSRDNRVAMADIVLLTPLVFLAAQM